MKKDEIIRMAQTCWFSSEDHHAIYGMLMRFAELVAAAEREACAQECERPHNPDGKPKSWSRSKTAYECAAAIRARGNT